MSEFKRIVNVIPLTRVKLSGSQIFTYLVPLNLHDQLRPGQLVEIPFAGRTIKGITTTFEMHRLPTEIKGFKELKRLIEPSPVMTTQNLSLSEWLSEYYLTSMGLVIKAMLPKLQIKPKALELIGYERFNPDFVLTEPQRLAVAQIGNALGSAASFLLKGVTGSGKTEVYMQIIDRLLERDKQVIILVPEISLTFQAIERYAKRFGIDKIAVLHSRLKDSERLWMWNEIRRGSKKIIIGARSAIFSPVQDLGLIILDEEHDSSFKQFDQNPKYHARTVAQKLSELWSCPLILGDATPSVETYHEALRGHINPAPSLGVLNPAGRIDSAIHPRGKTVGYSGRCGIKLLELPFRIKADVGLPRVQIIDMKKEAQSGARANPVFSQYLELAILEALKDKKQIILFLNRRGMSTVVMCRDCAYCPACTDCATSLVWHKHPPVSPPNLGGEQGGVLVCHHCGKRYGVPAVCPICGGTRFIYLGMGTQLVEEQIKKFVKKNLTQANAPVIQRMDQDSTLKEGEHSRIYREWATGKIQILIGTQMISKGWDVTRVGLVGIISADTILHLPDFRGGERTFQVLTQVAGRAGRGSDSGLVILQTYHPDNYAIENVRTHNYEKFYEKEIVFRQKHNYPPFGKLIKLTVSHTSPQKAAEKIASLFRKLISNKAMPAQVLGPVEAYFFRVRRKYRYQIILKTLKGSERELYTMLKDLPSDLDIDVDPESLL